MKYALRYFNMFVPGPIIDNKSTEAIFDIIEDAKQYAEQWKTTLVSLSPGSVDIVEVEIKESVVHGISNIIKTVGTL